MNVAQQGILTLIKSAVTEQMLPLPEGFDMEDAAALVEKHEIAALVCEGAALCGLPQNTPQMQKLVQTACKMLLISTAQMREVERITAAFAENGIDYMPIKGCNMKLLYPKPELRTMGDGDILIRMNQYPQIKPILERFGYVPVHEYDHELAWHHKNLFLELHRQLVSGSYPDLCAYFRDGWQLAVHQQDHRYAMTAENEMIYLFSHFAKHYRGGGIGCRHVVDLWVYRRAHPDLDEGLVGAELEKLGLQTFYRNICRLLQVWFEDAPSDEKTDFITDFIFSSGTWGSIEDRILSKSARIAGKRKGKLAYVLQTAFPSLEMMQHQYPVLKKAPWLLPVMWVVRWFARLVNPKAWKRQMRNMKTVTVDNIQTRQEALHYVGLDF